MSKTAFPQKKLCYGQIRVLSVCLLDTFDPVLFTLQRNQSLLTGFVHGTFFDDGSVGLLQAKGNSS